MLCWRHVILVRVGSFEEGCHRVGIQITETIFLVLFLFFLLLSSIEVEDRCLRLLLLHLRLREASHSASQAAGLVPIVDIAAKLTVVVIRPVVES